MRLLLLTLLPVMLVLAGCSYSPARITPEPLIVVDGSDRHYRGKKHHHRHKARHVERHYYYHDRGYRERRRGGFCPPGLSMQGRC
ncbi:hypothetical protein [Halomonas sp. BC04]|uniref:hypothetical protein n=1 Tax=Halomonas sp. BC04 TaxID=1403540 RepID=UPI0003ED6814|nr:hypothetical protein [Halomonas sp. BC04]EWG99133.1 hypothetical protein Q427_26730 [Halomonas sp. BC04]